jgi:hypothetical protein
MYVDYRINAMDQWRIMHTTGNTIVMVVNGGRLFHCTIGDVHGALISIERV